MRWFWIAIFSAVWCIGVGAGLVRMLDFELQPGRATAVPSRWPKDSTISADNRRPTLVLFLHPNCSCSRATLAELDRILARCGDGLALRLVFGPPQWPSGSGGSLFQRARQIPGGVIVQDFAGSEIRRFGAKTSGQALLYAPDGRLLFQGGLTPSRGHEGDNRGREAVISFVTQGQCPDRATAVFGCSLCNSEAVVPSGGPGR
jgi:hypothetical protein